MSKSKVALGAVVGILVAVSHLGLPSPWGDLVSSLLGVMAYLADHNKVAAALARKGAA